MKRARSFLWLLLVLSSSSLTRAETTSTLTVHVSTFRSTRGALFCRLFAGPDGFPSKATYRAQVRVPITGTAASCTFPQLASGTYAAGVFHDENGNGKLDTNFIGIPSEGVGVSNNKFPLIGPPSWNDARFHLSRAATLSIDLHY